ncbi:MAG: PIG-L family deacetylase [Candidatus Hydrogenedentes bacterium]|nr:PIG-L family deacetylase [Candidatus Hydrogenedentota bacterium]
MLSLPLAAPDGPLSLVCLGAHSDDIEIGCGGTILGLLGRHKRVSVHWLVFSATDQRADEAQQSARRFLKRAQQTHVELCDFRDGFFPYHGAAIKDIFERVKREVNPDVVFTHCRQDLHQDHRLLSELTRNTWRDHLILEYEIPKYDADLGAPNVYVPISKQHVAKKIEHLLNSFTSQRSKQWFDEETFRGLMRLRGVECNSPTRYAEAFYGHKITLTGT